MSVRAQDGDWIAVDWGTTTMRAAIVDAVGSVRARAPEGPGMGPIAREGGGAARFEAALQAAIVPWLGTDPIEVLVCGMAGARQGWVEAPYREVPTGLDGLLDAAVAAPVADTRLNVRVVPGLCARGGRPDTPSDTSRDALPDVMRGEETQLLGLLRSVRATRVCLPGTHAKWVDLDGKRVLAFRTHMTGELNAVLTDHSILAGDLAREGATPFDGAAFDAAVGAALDAQGAVLDRLFAIRAGGLLAGADGARARATLSGLLIGAEIARETAGNVWEVHLVGGDTLTALYARALSRAGVACVAHDGGDLAVAGLSAMRQGGG